MVDKSWRTEFATWHREPSLYREIYARTVSTLLAAFLVFIVAALAGLVTAELLVAVLNAIGLLAALIAGAAWVASGATRQRLVRAKWDKRSREWSAHRATALTCLSAGVVCLGSTGILLLMGEQPPWWPR